LEGELKEEVGEDSPIIRDVLAERVIGRFPIAEYRHGFVGLSNEIFGYPGRRGALHHQALQRVARRAGVEVMDVSTLSSMWRGRKRRATKRTKWSTNYAFHSFRASQRDMLNYSENGRANWPLCLDSYDAALGEY
jgi:hypothetical protein